MNHDGQVLARSARERAEAAVNELCARGGGLATFDADGVLWHGDSGNGFLLWQMENHRLTPEGERAAREGWDAYDRGQLDELEQAVLCATVCAGLREDALEADAAAFFNREFRRSIIAAVCDWACRLQQAGVEVWIVSGSHRWLIRAGACALGIREDRILAVATKVVNGVVTAELLHPVTYGEGKARAIRARLGRAPDLAAGNTFADCHMLALAAVSLAVEPDPELEARANERDWPVVRFK